MSTTLQIAEAARRSGFTPATLRYYEDIGLLVPPGRTDAGYRLYDETSLERLRFIARAKQLGCSLDEIAELVSVWEGGRCATVQEGLRTTVESKIAEAHAQIAELATFAAGLQRAAATLSTEPVDGPCDDTCACTTDVATATATPTPTETSEPPAAGVDTGTSDVARAAALWDDVASVDTATSDRANDGPIACSLGAGDIAARLDEWSALLAEEQDVLRGVISRHALDDGLRLQFGRNTDVAEIARLATAEHGCCRFFTFALTIDDRGIGLEVHAPADARPVLTALFGSN